MYKEISSSIDQISKKIGNHGRIINILAFFLIIFPFLQKGSLLEKSSIPIT